MYLEILESSKDYGISDIYVPFTKMRESSVRSFLPKSLPKTFFVDVRLL